MNKILSQWELNFAFFPSTHIPNGASCYGRRPHFKGGKTEACRGQDYTLKQQQS